MIKRIIFDIDGTIIPWDDESDKITFGKTFETFGIKYNKELISKCSKAIMEYENNNNTYKRENMIKEINLQTRLKLKVDFLEEWFSNILKYATPAKLKNSTIETLEYLSKKYELVSLSNWFEEPQKNRMKKVGIDVYFKQMYFSEFFKNKPSEEGFKLAMGNTKPYECLMVGDSLKIDIEPAIKCGMDAIRICKEKQKDENRNYISIEKIEKLITMY